MIVGRRTFVYVGDTVVPSALGRRNDFKVGIVFEIEMPDAYWIICDGNDDKLICVSRGQIDVVEN
jgi:hypothetical protein